MGGLRDAHGINNWFFKHTPFDLAHRLQLLEQVVSGRAFGSAILSRLRYKNQEAIACLSHKRVRLGRTQNQDHYRFKARFCTVEITPNSTLPVKDLKRWVNVAFRIQPMCQYN